ncbi:MAG: Rrf2 family transcriptional regulator [Acidimicrobiaceae bacterium]|nr:Rrf2 family transcriptional regulator [Acidimicrobiaceae bacterium]
MEISAKAEYSIRALAELTAAGGGPVPVVELAEAQDMPPRFLQNLLSQLRRRGVVFSQRGTEGGYRLARPASEISLAEVLRAIDGPLANVAGERPEDLHYTPPADHLADVWIAVRVALREVLEEVSIADVVEGRLPPVVLDLLARAGDPRGSSGSLAVPASPG